MSWNLVYNFRIALFICVLGISVLLLKNPIISSDHSSENSHDIYSSVWCHSSNFGKRCSFNNLCYNPKVNNFLFIINKGTIISGIKSRNELKEISTSWLNLSNFYLNISVVKSVEDYKLFKYRVMLISRFKPDNIMHVFHDDLLPLYVTYKRVCLGKVEQCASEFLIAYFDNFNSRFHRLYEIFSYATPFSLSSIGHTTCFESVYVGLDSDSIFYQYGYKKPQGPLLPLIRGEVLYEFSEYILRNLKIKRKSSSKCTLIGRLVNRRILNERYIIQLIKNVYMKVTNESIFVNNLDVNSYPIEHIIRSIVESKLLLGMHGAGMILAIFLPIGSVAVELFPYGIVKEHVSPLCSLSKLAGIKFRYFSWTNQFKENSLFHPEYPLLHGGFKNISELQKKRILASTSVPAVHCCHDPVYLYFMYQDTYVDHSIERVLTQSFETNMSTVEKDKFYEIWYFPDQVRNISCSFINSSDINLNWDPPTNVENNSECLYKITLVTSLQKKTYISHSSFMNVRISSNERFVLIWLKCVLNGVEGSDTYFICNSVLI